MCKIGGMPFYKPYMFIVSLPMIRQDVQIYYCVLIFGLKIEDRSWLGSGLKIVLGLRLEVKHKIRIIK